MGKLEGKAAIITGAASGIGRATALLFVQEGAKVVVADLDETKGREVVREIVDVGGTSIFVKVDVSQPEDVQRMVKAAVDQFGRLDIIFNNAGVTASEPSSLVDVSLESWDKVVNINLKGVFLGMKYAIPEMLKNGGGAIINMSSAGGLVGFVGDPAYCASKGGVIQLTRAAALEYARQGIRVNAICPSYIWTPMNQRVVATREEGFREMIEAALPMGRLGQPEEIARMALFLACDDSSFCTGAPFIIDGGFVAA